MRKVAEEFRNNSLEPEEETPKQSDQNKGNYLKGCGRDIGNKKEIISFDLECKIPVRKDKIL